MWITVVENFHIPPGKLSELEAIENLVMGESAINAYTLQPLAHYAKLFTLELTFAPPDNGSGGFKILETSPLEELETAAPPAGFDFDGRRRVYGAAEFIRSFSDRGHAHLFGFYVDEALRSRGAASWFLNRCEKALRLDYLISAIDLSVAEDNLRAAAFYRKNGYSVSESVKDYYGSGRDRLIMNKKI
ncbi:MAG TPA: N-acetyltransferase [Candidatus Wallbacteria bacterium]|nr:MAG: Acetyltransferase (GNAT) family protein [bacterium ADurb.Bin243]HPG57279.1 N-acetyltransferase [Candidatus Wallbacteria bacterium]